MKIVPATLPSFQKSSRQMDISQVLDKLDNINKASIQQLNNDENQKIQHHSKDDSFIEEINIHDNDQQQTEKYQYNPDKIPFDLQISKIHQEANRVYQPITRQDMQQLHDEGKKFCPCCNMPQNGQLINLFTDTTNLSHLGPAYPLYFQFLKYAIGIVIIICIFSSCYTISINYDGNRCQEIFQKNKLCQVNFIQQLATTNLSINEPDENLAILNITCNIILMIFMIIYKGQLLKYEYDIDKSDINVSDYTIMFMNIPISDQILKEDFRIWLDDNLEEAIGVKINIEKICYTYSINDLYLPLTKQLDQMYHDLQFKLNKYSEAELQIKFGKQQIDNEKKLIEDTKIKINEYKQNCINSTSLKYSNGVAFVSFETELQAVQILDYLKKTSFRKLKECFKEHSQRYFKGYEIISKAAPEPTDIIWENLEIDFEERQNRRVKTKIIAFLILCVSLGLILLLNLEQKQGEQNDVFLISILISLLIILINQILVIAFKILTNKEVYTTKTNYYIALSVKLGSAQFINSALITFIVDRMNNDYQIYESGGLITNITLIFFSNMIVPSLGEIFNFEYIKKKILQKYYISRVKARHKLSQKESNELFESYKMDLSVRYASDIKTLLMCAFYAYLIPLGPLLSVITLILSYMINKYNLLRKQGKPFALGSLLAKKMIDIYLQLINVSFTCGCFIFEIIIYQKFHVITAISLAISIAYYILPLDKVLQVIGSINSRHIEQNTYQENKKKFEFETDYDRYNPITSLEATKEYIQYCIDNNQGVKKDLQLNILNSFTDNNEYFNEQNQKKQKEGPRIQN